ncbi:RNA polymerase sigma-70 factor [Chitinophaga niabensis]|uniref:RNA polymerase sigma factor n=1 Tax=Chitinophaga niabensis TaxID=536979 RepID=UPI0031BAEB25
MNYDCQSDTLLLELLKKGDDKAFTAMYNRYWDRLLFIAGIKFRDLAIAEEMVQDVFLDLWKRREELDITTGLEPYLAVSIKYKVINAQAKLKRAMEYQQYAVHHNPPQGSDTEEWLRFKELKHKLSRLVSALPEKCRITYQLSREEGLSQNEIAARLNVSKKAVEANLSRALKSLRKAFNQLTASMLTILP